LKQHAFPPLGRLFVDSIDEKDIVTALSPLWHDRPAAARKLRQRINTVLDFAKGYGWRSTGAPWDSLRSLLSKQARRETSPPCPTLTCPRRAGGAVFHNSEVRSACWSHVDLEAGTSTRPAELMKSREAHAVTLSPAAIAVKAQVELPRLLV
jgi:integrase